MEGRALEFRVAAILIAGAAVAISSFGGALVPDGSVVGIASHVACHEVGRVPRPVDHCARWTYRYLGDGLRDDYILELITSADGGVLYAVGQTDRANGGPEGLVLALDATLGLPVWEATWGGAAGPHNHFSRVALSPDGQTLYVVGITESAPDNYDALITAFDASTGALLWTTTYEGGAEMNDSARTLVLSEDGSILYVGGSTREVGPHADYLVLAVETATGAVVWSWSHDGPGNDSDTLVDIALDPGAERLYVTGHVRQPDGGWDVRTFALDPASGGALWMATFERPTGFDFAQAVLVHPDGSGLWVIAQIPTPGRGWDVYQVAYDPSSGRELLFSAYDGGQNVNEVVNGVSMSPDGRSVYVTGTRAADQGRLFVAALASPDGNALWDFELGTPIDYYVGGGVAVSVDGAALAVRGRTFWIDVPPDVSIEGDIVSLVLAADDGQLLWSARYNGPGGEDEFSTDVVWSPDGRRTFTSGFGVVVDPVSTVSSGWDGLVIAYEVPLRRAP